MSLIYAQMTRMLFKVKCYLQSKCFKTSNQVSTYIIHLNMKPITIWFLKKIVATYLGRKLAIK